ncbi:MAG TPA: threonine synthase [Acidimicrobiaceae bacterium]|jgi:threonine synthase|nr:threonine synthase [Actinomycetota bacterium]NCG39939.1 threonine synthase [Actinomycetota bacterium]HAN07718.1 threonine synthase [Acidimicrobiaceae bacterium]
MRYESTRGGAPILEFSDVLLEGLASDGGLYVPKQWPLITKTELRSLANVPYAEVAQRVLAPLVGPSISFETLGDLTHRAYANFRHDEVAPVVELGEFFLVELHWGPTFSFKDIALQLLGQLFEYELERRDKKITIVGATSGDTGSAAIEACKDRAGIELVMLHPKGRVSEIQRLQMTTVESLNIHNIAIDGTFDDCQDLVKAMFAQEKFRSEMSLAAVNSINWARVAAQSVYYVTTALKLGAPDRKVSFCVPTGNFGNVMAGYMASQMGVPIERLVVASNHNDILSRTYETGTMSMEPVRPSLSPAMDIQVSSNFERLLFDLSERKGRELAEQFKEFRRSGNWVLNSEVLKTLRTKFIADKASDEQVLSTIRQVHQKTGVLVDPHTAVGISVAERQPPSSSAMAIMSTAHPAKFPDAVTEATGSAFNLPPELSSLSSLDERCDFLPNNLNLVMDRVREVTK